MEFPRYKDVNINDAFQKFKDHTFIRYRGALIMRDKHPETKQECFYWKEKWFDDINVAQTAVDDAIKALSESIKISMTIEKDGKEIEVGEEHTGRFFVGESAYRSFKESQIVDN